MSEHVAPAHSDQPGDTAGRPRAAPNGHENPAAAVQAVIAEHRARLLGGRGPGASTTEIEAATRARPLLGGEPTPQHLQALAHRTTLIRGDPDALALNIATSRDRISRTVGALREKVSAHHGVSWAGRAARGGGRGRIAAATVVAIVAVVVVLRRR